MGECETRADLRRDRGKRDLQQNLSRDRQFEERGGRITEASGVDHILAFFLHHRESVEVVAGVREVPQILTGRVVNLNPILFTADYGHIKVSSRIHIDLPVGVTEGHKPFGRSGPTLLKIVFMGGGDSRKSDAGK